MAANESSWSAEPSNACGVLRLAALRVLVAMRSDAPLGAESGLYNPPRWGSEHMREPAKSHKKQAMHRVYQEAYGV
jgi:hypothetical protein